MTPTGTSPAPRYTEYHPRSYRTRISTYWWLWPWPYLKFVLRELSSVFVAFFVVTTLGLIRGLGAGSKSYAEFQQLLRSPLFIVLNLVSLMFVLFHTITWFNLAPRAMAVRLGGQRVPDVLIAGANYVAWLVISAFLAWIILR